MLTLKNGVALAKPPEFRPTQTASFWFRQYYTWRAKVSEDDQCDALCYGLNHD